MTRSTASRLALAALVAALHLGGLSTGPPSGQATTVRYFCCCVGECHCTGDCCNHPPEPGNETRRATFGAGRGSARWEAQRSCGGLRIALVRGSERPALLPLRTVAWRRPSEDLVRGLHREDAPPSRSDHSLRAATPPRAPPA